MRRWVTIPIGFLLAVFAITGSASAEESTEPNASAPRIVRETPPENRRTMPYTEPEKIEKLLEKVAKSKGIVFERNGTNHTGEEAAKHLRRKWEYKKKEILTARQFVNKLASRSSLSGKSYHVILPGGQKLPSLVWFMRELSKIEAEPIGLPVFPIYAPKKAAPEQERPEASEEQPSEKK